MKKHVIFRNILIDLACAGAALVVFALFHHVLPRQQQGLGIVISNPYRTESGGDSTGFALPENAMLTASAGISDTPLTASARGGRQNSGGRGSKSGGMNGKGGSALTEDGTEETAEADDTPISEKFADRYTDTVTITENSYSSPDISVTVTEETYGRVYRELLAETKRVSPGVKFILLEPFHLSEDENWIRVMEVLRPTVKEIAGEFGAVFVPLQEEFRKRAEADGSKYWLWDGVHPTEAGHWVVARRVLEQGAEVFGIGGAAEEAEP